jgi:hypothetical protein
VLMQNYLGPHALNLPPALLRRLAPDYMDRQEGGDLNGAPVPTDFSLAEQRLTLQRDIVAYLMNETLADRLLDNIDKTRDIEPQPLSVRVLYNALQDAIWLDQGVPADVSSSRRNLQRDHINRLAALLVRGSSNRADVRAQVRDQSTRLLKRLRQQQDEAKSTSEAGAHQHRKARQPEGIQQDEAFAVQAHLQDCIDILSRALDAMVVRAAP